MQLVLRWFGQKNLGKEQGLKFTKSEDTPLPNQDVCSPCWVQMKQWKFTVKHSFPYKTLVVNRLCRKPFLPVLSASEVRPSFWFWPSFSSFQFIPMPVLYGVFLYMGASSLKGIQVSEIFFVRLLLRLSFAPCLHYTHCWVSQRYWKGATNTKWSPATFSVTGSRNLRRAPQ